MGFVQRAFTPPGTGDMSAVVAQQTAAAESLKAAQARPAPIPPTLPTAPEAPKTFAPGQSPGAKQRAQITATSMLGAAATSGQQARKSVLGA